MSESNLIRPMPGALHVGAGKEVSCFELKSEVAVCVFDAGNKIAACVKLGRDNANLPFVQGIEKKLANLLPGAKNLVVKIIGPEPILADVAKLFSGTKVKVTSKHACANGSSVYFYHDTGRVRCSVAQSAANRVSSETAKVLPIAAGQPARKKRILIVEDSPAVAALLAKLFERDPGLEVVGIAGRPSQVEKIIIEKSPDVITLDIHLPEMDGISLLQQYLPRHPIPTIMITSMRMEDGPFLLRAMEIGAVDYVQKPSMAQLHDEGPRIIELVKQAANAKLVAKPSRVDPNEVEYHASLSQNTVIAIGSSTGGTEAVKHLLMRLPKGLPGIIIAQHIPAVFSKAFADRLNEVCPSFEVREAADGDSIEPGKVLICPGGKQTFIKPHGKNFQVVVEDAPPLARFTPSIDVLFESVAKEAGNKSIGVILTGMGNDGSKGLLSMRRKGAKTIAQDEASCVIFGMPREAIKLGAVEEILPIGQMSPTLIRWLREKKAA